MKISFPSCDQNLDIPEELVGQTIDCPACNESLIAPKTATTAQAKLKISQTPNPAGLSKTQISKRQSTQGSQTTMHVASHLTGSRTQLRETSASKFSGSMTSMIVGVFVVGVILFKLGFGGDLFKGGVVKIHERIVSIEDKMTDSYNSSDTPQDASTAVAAAVAKLKKNQNRTFERRIQSRAPRLHQGSSKMEFGT